MEIENAFHFQYNLLLVQHSYYNDISNIFIVDSGSRIIIGRSSYLLNYDAVNAQKVTV